MTETSGTIVHWLPSVLAAGAFIIAIVVAVKYKIPALTKRIVKMEKQTHKQQVTAMDMLNTVKKHEIYSRDGTARYQHVSDCTLYQGSYCKKIDEVKSEVGEIKAQLKGMSDARMQEAKDLAQTMARVQGMIEKDRTEELKVLAKMIVKQTKG